MAFKRKIKELIPGYTQDLDMILLFAGLGIVFVGAMWYWPLAWAGAIAILALTAKEVVNSRQ